MLTLERAQQPASIAKTKKITCLKSGVLHLKYRQILNIVYGYIYIYSYFAVKFVYFGNFLTKNLQDYLFNHFKSNSCLFYKIGANKLNSLPKLREGMFNRVSHFPGIQICKRDQQPSKMDFWDWNRNTTLSCKKN